MHRVQDLVSYAKRAHPDDSFFSDFDASLQCWPQKRRYYERYEKAFATLTDQSWVNLRNKAVAHFHETRSHERKGPFFDQLNDALACQWLMQRGFSAITILNETPDDKKSKCPDISFLAGATELFCETKTINTSIQEHKDRAERRYRDSRRYERLHPTFMRKIDEAIAAGTSQIQAVRGFGLIFLIVLFDDFTMTYYPQHRLQIANHMLGHRGLPYLIKFGVFGSRRIEGIHALLESVATQQQR